MTQEQVLLILFAAAAGLLLHYYWNLHNYPLIACSKCHGSSLRTKWIFHVSSLRFRKIGGHCKRCGGKPWTERRGSGR